jgi:hypothetical protein
LWVSQKGPERYLAEDGPRVARVLHWVMGFYSYLALLTDRLPTDADLEKSVHFDVRPDGAPSAGSALWRLVTSLPAALFLALLGIASCFAWLVAMLFVLVDRRYPAALYDFQRGVLPVRGAAAGVPRVAGGGVPAVRARHRPRAVAGRGRCVTTL